MSRLNANHIFTSESVSEGHPDKVCDLISDAIVDACLAKDANSRVACESLVTTDFVMTAGEITCQGFESLDTEAIARKVVRDIGYDRKDYLFCADTFEYQTRLHGQSPDIAQGVNEGPASIPIRVPATRDDVRLCQQRDSRTDACPHRLQPPPPFPSG